VEFSGNTYEMVVSRAYVLFSSVEGMCVNINFI